MKEEDSDCKFPQLYRGKNHGREADEGGSWGKQHGRNFLMGELACCALLFRVAWGLEVPIIA